MIVLLPHPENEPPQSITNPWSCTVVNHGITQIFELIMELLTAYIAKNLAYKRQNTVLKIIDIANCKTCNERLLDVEYMILVSY